MYSLGCHTVVDPTISVGFNLTTMKDMFFDAWTYVRCQSSAQQVASWTFLLHVGSLNGLSEIASTLSNSEYLKKTNNISVHKINRKCFEFLKLVFFRRFRIVKRTLLQKSAENTGIQRFSKLTYETMNFKKKYVQNLLNKTFYNWIQ